MVVKLNKRDFKYNACWFRVHKDEIDIEDMLRFSDNSVIGDDEFYETILGFNADKYVLVRGTNSGIVRLVEKSNLIKDIKVGDYVTVIDDGKIYPTNTNWFCFHRNEIPYDYALRYHYNPYMREKLNGECFTVLFIDNEEKKALIGNGELSNVYLIGLDGIRIKEKEE